MKRSLLLFGSVLISLLSGCDGVLTVGEDPGRSSMNPFNDVEPYGEEYNSVGFFVSDIEYRQRSYFNSWFEPMINWIPIVYNSLDSLLFKSEVRPNDKSISNYWDDPKYDTYIRRIAFLLGPDELAGGGPLKVKSECVVLCDNRLNILEIVSGQIEANYEATDNYCYGSFSLVYKDANNITQEISGGRFKLRSHISEYSINFKYEIDGLRDSWARL